MSTGSLTVTLEVGIKLDVEVIDQSGAPIPGVLVQLTPARFALSSHEELPVRLQSDLAQFVTTDASGRASLLAFSTDMEVGVSSSDSPYVWPRRKLTDEDLKKGVVRLRRIRREQVSVRIIDSAGVPIAYAIISPGPSMSVSGENGWASLLIPQPPPRKDELTLKFGGAATGDRVVRISQVKHGQDIVAKRKQTPSEFEFLVRASSSFRPATILQYALRQKGSRSTAASGSVRVGEPGRIRVPATGEFVLELSHGEGPAVTYPVPTDKNRMQVDLPSTFRIALKNESGKPVKVIIRDIQRGTWWRSGLMSPAAAIDVLLFESRRHYTVEGTSAGHLAGKLSGFRAADVTEIVMTPSGFLVN